MIIICPKHGEFEQIAQSHMSGHGCSKCSSSHPMNNKSLILRINDRGPYVGDRILDCSYGAAKKLDFLIEGVTEVKIEIMEWGDNVYMHHDRHK